MKNKLALISAIIFFGSIWGILEATLGYVLHFLPIYIAGTILFPIVSLILYKAYQMTKSSSALLIVGILAASIKALNFFLPYGSPFKIINPMLSIIFEALLVMVVIKVMDKSSLMKKAGAFTLASMGWRLLYVAYMGVQFLTTGFVHAYIASFYAMFEYVVLYGLLSAGFALIIHLGFRYLEQKINYKTSHVSVALSMAALVIAVLLTLFA